MTTMLHTIAAYFLLLLTVRILKRRAGSQISMIDFVLIFLIGGTAILATLGPDHSMTNATLAVITVATLHRAIAWAKSKMPSLGALIDGVPIVILDRGEWRDDVMTQMRLRHMDVEIAARSNRIANVDKVDYAIVERNGTISVIPKPE